MQHYFSLRLKLDDIIKNEDFEKKVLENIRYCRKLLDKKFRVIFWNENLTENQCKEFINRNEHLLFEVHTLITKDFLPVWYLIEGVGDKSKWRYKSDGYTEDCILGGIASYIKLIKHMNEKDKN